MDSPTQAGDEREEAESSLTHRIPRKPYPHYIDDTVFLEVQELLRQHPDKPVQAWSENPRLYTLLRMLGYDDDSKVLQKFDSERIGDFWLPLPSSTLTHLSSTGLTPSDFRRAQLHILSRSEQMSEERLSSSVHTHRHIEYGSAHFEEIEKIGTGGSAEVVRVRHKLSGKQYACKRILRADTIKGQRNQLIEFEQEVGALQRINHHHFVSFVASFTDLNSFSLILNPVAKDVLKSMLERQNRDQPLPLTDISVLRHAFGCLATALACLHDQRVRHKDIKPGNILLSEGRVYLCDFGIARDWSKSENSTTEGDVLKFTRRYCAPEVFGRDPRNTKSDIYSLGCVYLEMISVIKGYPLEEMNEFLLEHSDGATAQGLRCAPDAINAWLVKIRSENHDSADDLPLDWITPMIRTEPEDRPKASEIVNVIHRQSADIPHPNLFLATCCSRSDSIIPYDALESPTSPTHPPNLPHQLSKGLGIVNVPASPPRSFLGPDPHNRRPGSREHRNGSSSRKSGSRDRSISPRTPSTDVARTSSNMVRDSTDSAPFPMDPIPSPPSSRKLRNIPTRSESERQSDSSFPMMPESIASSSGFRRSPIPPPASFDVKCACAARAKENHILNLPFASSTIHTQQRTVETCSTCEIGENKVQVYESLPEDTNVPKAQSLLIWWVTRRLAISYLSGTPEMRRCSSFWIPLADVQFIASGTDVTLRWSDCNQMTQRSSGNYGQHYDWMYNPKEPNNSVTIHFHETEHAEQFRDVLRAPCEDGLTVSSGRRIDVSDAQELQIFDVGRRGIRNYRCTTLTTFDNTFITSKLFVIWPELDLDIRIYDAQTDRFANEPNYQMAVKLNNVSAPTYHSDVRGEPAVDYDKIGRFYKALQLKSSFSVTFPIGMRHCLPTPPLGVMEMLHGLTGWTLRYFAIVESFKSKKKHFGSKKYGRADLMLWEKDVDEGAIKRRGAQVAFRLHDEADFLWTTGAVTASTSISYSTACDATITVSNRTRGRLLDITKMSAIASEKPNDTRSHGHGHGHARVTSDAHDGDSSEMVLTFDDTKYRLDFVTIVEQFKADAAPSVPLMEKGVPESVRRINSLASSEMGRSPPIR